MRIGLGGPLLLSVSSGARSTGADRRYCSVESAHVHAHLPTARQAAFRGTDRLAYTSHELLRVPRGQCLLLGSRASDRRRGIWMGEGRKRVCPVNIGSGT
jgi:hypothetical protein